MEACLVHLVLTGGKNMCEVPECNLAGMIVFGSLTIALTIGWLMGKFGRKP